MFYSYWYNVNEYKFRDYKLIPSVNEYDNAYNWYNVLSRSEKII